LTKITKKDTPAVLISVGLKQH
jgi:hypothetical protein